MRKAFRGYAVEEVDAFLSRCAGALRWSDAFPELRALPAAGPAPTREEVEMVQFSVAFRGYDLEVVDSLLDRVAAALPD